MADSETELAQRIAKALAILADAKRVRDAMAAGPRAMGALLVEIRQTLEGGKP